jgi:hypothetical protein
MHWVGFELTISEFERAKTVHALDRSATVTGEQTIIILNYLQESFWGNTKFRNEMYKLSIDADRNLKTTDAVTSFSNTYKIQYIDNIKLNSVKISIQ